MLQAITNAFNSTLDTSHHTQFHILNNNSKNNYNLRVVAKKRY